MGLASTWWNWPDLLVAGAFLGVGLLYFWLIMHSWRVMRFLRRSICRRRSNSADASAWPIGARSTSRITRDPNAAPAWIVARLLARRTDDAARCRPMSLAPRSPAPGHRAGPAGPGASCQPRGVAPRIPGAVTEAGHHARMAAPAAKKSPTAERISPDPGRQLGRAAFTAGNHGKSRSVRGRVEFPGRENRGTGAATATAPCTPLPSC